MASIVVLLVIIIGIALYRIGRIVKDNEQDELTDTERYSREMNQDKNQ